MKLLYGVLIAGLFQSEKVHPKKIVKTIKKESKFWLRLITQIGKHYK